MVRFMILLLLLPQLLAVVRSDIPRACAPPHDSFPFCNTSLSRANRIDDLLARLALRDKVWLLTARASPKGNVSAIGLPEYNWGANCVHGVQSTCGTHCATSFPNPVNLGAVFDPKAVHAMAQVIGWELRALWLEGAREHYTHGPHVGLDCWSPNLNINRDPRWGRNMETPSEDPVVNARYGVAYTRGLQQGRDPRFLQAVVTLKHWAAYSFEHYDNVDRMEFDALVAPYDWSDTYVPAFRAAIVDAHARGVMCSYNSVNGVPMCANAMATTLLRDTFGFDGYVTSDSGAVRGIFEKRHYTPTLCDAARLALLSGTDVNSGNAYDSCLEALVESGRLDAKVVDTAVRRTLALRFDLGLFDPIEDQPYWHVSPNDVNTPAAQNLSRELARKSLVLLQNRNATLPLPRDRFETLTLAVLGPHATAREALLGNYFGQICPDDTFDCVTSPLEALEQRVAHVLYARGCGVNDSSTAGFRDAIAAAERADVVVLFLGIDTSIEREASDRESIELPAVQLALLRAVRRSSAVSKPTVVVLFNGGVVGVEEVVVYTDALVEAFYPGVYGAEAVAAILFGDESPSGKLPVTMYRSNYVDAVSMKSMSMTAYPGRSYKYYKEVPVFPFGWGLSYTTFSLASGSTAPLKTVNDGPAATTPRPTHTHVVTEYTNATYSIVVSNDGAVAGDEVVFAFFRPLKTSATGPATLLNQQLFAYERVRLAPQQVVELTFTVADTTLALVDNAGHLMVFPGFYEIFFTNGVAERLAFLVHVQSAKRVIRAFEMPRAASTSVESDESSTASTPYSNDEPLAVQHALHVPLPRATEGDDVDALTAVE